MTTKAYWEAVYRDKAQEVVSWYRPHLEKSVQLIEVAAPDHGAAIIDVGGGESTLVDDLLLRGYRDISVLDISPLALQVARQRLGNAANTVKWLVGDITQANLPRQRYDVWHDRAVFHFLVDRQQRAAYVQQVLHSLAPNGHLVMATFGPEGPQQCSGLETVRYDTKRLSEQLGPRFELVDHSLEYHRTPGGSIQQFLYACFRKTG
ncbi:methyltransferase domain-containing protein [Halomonas sp. ZH2S]|uniref:Methyltransferase domain-containing protein n=1 Tax=Vreelandella zhuhanensis TaxID=2684210 RepID=A0A7X3KR25_9GAMM|nr:class I SAM-dependent methyltransferase [Halomonas zhuhanensis]MWJ29115.1 methyltransferase domain-containing protein [Halomonas zhuhanensis]